MTPADKLCTPKHLPERLAALPKPWGFTNGVFDLLHAGHVQCLAAARAQCASLIVALNTDRSARALGKGPGRPLVKQKDRALVVAGLASTDLVTLFDEPNPCELLRKVKPEIYFKGGDYEMDKLEEAGAMRGWGGKAVTIPFVSGYSTSSLHERSTSAQPDKRPKPSKNRSPEQAIRIVSRGDGSWIPADRASNNLAKDRGLLHSGVEVIGYLYQPRDGKQWRKIHALGSLLAQSVDEFHGWNSHDVIKKVQLDANVACENEEIDLGKLGVFSRRVAKSLAFGFMDESEFTGVYREISVYIGKKYFGFLGPEAEGEIAKLLLREPTAS